MKLCCLFWHKWSFSGAKDWLVYSSWADTKLFSFHICKFFKVIARNLLYFYQSGTQKVPKLWKEFFDMFFQVQNLPFFCLKFLMDLTYLKKRSWDKVSFASIKTILDPHIGTFEFWVSIYIMIIFILNQSF